ncbi:MAG: N-methyl-L-tryptophan oxidase [Pirellulaceae bacterium]
MAAYDLIVIGTGGVGSAALYQAARRGQRALGIDRFPGGHDRGSSHGQTRIIRRAYFEHPDYVPLLDRAYELWKELETAAERPLYFPVGLIEIGPRDGVLVPGVLTAAEKYRLPLERLTSDDVARRFSGFHVPDGYEALFESDAGYLLVEQCVLTYLEQAQRLGAELAIGDEVVDWRDEAGEIVVHTATATYRAPRVIVTAGAWSEGLLRSLGVRLQVVRKHLHWYRCDVERYRADRGCPAFFYEVPSGYFYGFPQIDDAGVKLAEHSGGTEVANPLADDRQPEAEDDRRVERFLREYLPGVTGRQTQHAVCFYTRSPDEHFIIDRHPHHPNVVFAAGLSGHGFKFASVLGEILVDLAVDGATASPIDFLSSRRFGNNLAV